MQDTHVIQPSSSPWASPVVLERKKDGSLHFCVDYCELNKVTKADTFPLPRMDMPGECQMFLHTLSKIGIVDMLSPKRK